VDQGATLRGPSDRGPARRPINGATQPDVASGASPVAVGASRQAVDGGASALPGEGGALVQPVAGGAAHVAGAASVQRTFDLSGGALCLDFANTLDDRPSPVPNDSLAAYPDILEFTRQSGSLPEGHLAFLDTEALRSPEAAEAARARAIEVREAIYRLFAALADEQPVPASDLSALNRALGEALAHACVVEDGRGFAWGWPDDPIDLAAPLWPVVRSAADLLTSPELSSLRLCASESCAWLFLDTSRNGSRRWCSMRTCGNRAKARRHHARVRAAGSPDATD
jgi:predicted RNA-binding Zn ribbon-like protein